MIYQLNETGRYIKTQQILMLERRIFKPNHSSLDHHKNEHKEFKFKCSRCGESFPSARRLKVHKVTHHRIATFCCVF